MGPRSWACVPCIAAVETYVWWRHMELLTHIKPISAPWVGSHLQGVAWWGCWQSSAGCSLVGALTLQWLIPKTGGGRKCQGPRAAVPSGFWQLKDTLSRFSSCCRCFCELFHLILTIAWERESSDYSCVKFLSNKVKLVGEQGSQDLNSGWGLWKAFSHPGIPQETVKGCQNCQALLGIWFR